MSTEPQQTVQPINTPKKGRRWLKQVTMILSVAFLALVIWAYVWSRRNYPFGGSHCCIKALGLSLQIYAHDHKGKFPSGAGSPEASLGLLTKDTGCTLEILRGKTVPVEVTTAALLHDGKLGPESCGWYYVEGLEEKDDHSIAVLWDKFGLGHNGQRIKQGGHEVLFADGSISVLSGNRWDEFIEQQRQLLAAHDPPLTNALNAWFTNYALHDSRHEELGH